MDSTPSTRQLLDIYYKGFAAKQGWEEVLADDFTYTGGDMANTAPVSKAGYIAIIQRFSQAFTAMRVKEMIISGDKACVIGNYDFRFPDGVVQNGDVAELWTAMDGKLTSLTIFFDTHIFKQHTPK